MVTLVTLKYPGSMEIVSTGVLDKNKERYLRSKDKESLYIYIYYPKIPTDNHIMWIIKSYNAYAMY